MFVPTMQELFSSNAKLSADHQLMTSALVERGGRSDRRTALCQSLSLCNFFQIFWVALKRNPQQGDQD